MRIEPGLATIDQSRGHPATSAATAVADHEALTVIP
jgi:hypothetical protein